MGENQRIWFGKLRRGVVFHKDSVTVHSSNGCNTRPFHLIWQPSDYYLLLKMKKELISHNFDSDDDVIAAVDHFLTWHRSWFLFTASSSNSESGSRLLWSLILHDQAPAYIRDLLQPCIASRSCKVLGSEFVSCSSIKTKADFSAFEVVAPF